MRVRLSLPLLGLPCSFQLRVEIGVMKNLTGECGFTADAVLARDAFRFWKKASTKEGLNDEIQGRTVPVGPEQTAIKGRYRRHDRNDGGKSQADGGEAIHPVDRSGNEEGHAVRLPIRSDVAGL